MAIAKKIDGFISQASFIRKMFEEGIRLKELYGAGNVSISVSATRISTRLRPSKSVCCGLPPLISRESTCTCRMRAIRTRGRRVAEALSSSRGVALTADQIVMTCGAGGALNVIFKTLLDPGEEVIIPAPFFVEYRFYVDNAGGTTRIVPTREDFSLDLGAIREAITEKTKAVLINSPNNPTGKVYDSENICGLADLLIEKSAELKREIYLVSDEPYSEIVYDGLIVPSVLAAYPHSLIASSYSKSLSLPGERIGYIAVNPAIAGIGEVMGGLTLCNRILGFVHALP